VPPAATMHTIIPMLCLLALMHHLITAPCVLDTISVLNWIFTFFIGFDPGLVEFS